MKTTIDIPEPLYRRAKVHAIQHGVTLRELVLGALQAHLQPAPARPRHEPHFKVDGLGLPCLRRPATDRTRVTEEFLGQLREQEGV